MATRAKPKTFRALKKKAGELLEGEHDKVASCGRDGFNRPSKARSAQMMWLRRLGGGEGRILWRGDDASTKERTQQVNHSTLQGR